MQNVFLIVAAVGVTALSYFLFYLGGFFKSLIKMNEPTKCEDEEEEIEDDFDYDDDCEADAPDFGDYETIELDEPDTNVVLSKRKGRRNNCVISQIDNYYGSCGVYGLTEFLVDNGAGFSVHSFNATCLLRGVIAYVRFFQDENRQDMEALVNLLIKAERYGTRWLEKEVQDLEEREKTAEMREIYDNMVDDFGYSGVVDSEDSDRTVELAISVLLPYVSGYTVIYKDYEYNWKLTNTNMNIAATARQREWQRQILINLDCIEETLREMQYQAVQLQQMPKMPTKEVQTWDID